MEHETQIHLESTLEEHSREFRNQKIINDILRISLSPYLFQELLERILHHLTAQKSLRLAQKAAVFIVNDNANGLQLKASLGFSRNQIVQCEKIQLGHCHCGRAAQRKAIHFFDVAPPLHKAINETTPHQAHYCIPIIKDDLPVGVLVLYVRDHHELTVETEQLLESIANILATVIENQRMDRQLVELVNDLRISIISLREEKLFSDSVIQNLNHGLIVADLRGNILKSNSKARQILEYHSGLDGKNLQSLVGACKAASLMTVNSDKADAQEHELILSLENGEEKILSFSTTAQCGARGNQLGVIISLSDVTELRYVHKEMEKMNRLSTVAEIASAVAHEVRNPLAGIKIMAQSIEEEAADNGQQLECSRRIIRQVDRLNELLTEFFSYARPVEPNKRPISLSTILAETKPLISNRLSKNAIDLVENIPPHLPNIVADPNQMQQVFLNLMLNSIDAIRQNGFIEISGRFLTGNGVGAFKRKYPGLLKGKKFIFVSFSDNGAGMPEEVAEKVFEPFFTTKSTGTGLGLSIVYRTLKENDAMITLESIPGKGTTFNMFFQTNE